MKITILCSLLMSATAYHGGPFIKQTNVELVPNVKQIDQAPMGGHPKPEINIRVNVQSTTSTDISYSQDDIGQKVQSNEVDDDILQLIFGSKKVTGIESSTTQFYGADYISLNCSEPTQYNVNNENSGVGHIDIRSIGKGLRAQDIPEQGQYAHESPKLGSQGRGSMRNQFGTSFNNPYGSEDNSNVGCNSVGFSSTTDLIHPGQTTTEVPPTPSTQVEIKSSQPNWPENQGGQSNVRPTNPVFRPVNQDGSSQPRVNPSYPNTRPEYKGGNSQPGVNPTYSITRPGNQDRGRQPGITHTYPNTRPGNQGGSTWPGLNPAYSITRPNNFGESIQPRITPNYPIFQPGNQGPVYWPNIQIGVNPTGASIGQGSVPPNIPGYWPYVQYVAYYSPDFVPGQSGYGYHDWVGNSQGYFYGYPPNEPQYGWQYTQDPLACSNGWFGFGGQEARSYNHNQDGLNGQQHQHSHHQNHQQPGGGYHGYPVHYNHNKGY